MSTDIDDFYLCAIQVCVLKRKQLHYKYISVDTRGVASCALGWARSTRVESYLLLWHLLFGMHRICDHSDIHRDHMWRGWRPVFLGRLLVVLPEIN